ncbi:putative transcriptional regulator YheO [Lachnotalea glycerini]|uniref:Transcriptional regulator n=1 Tax=Lachnotalea glycerini TaxID=1763509 RepID=A0A255I6P7_9FIRM|nr:helix-turn-helix transcriptional regulator [Lachnotalea glycerini]PXV86879.1 putative transcriptional regulator YheO [Lachnotalea glycerini]RDY30677.1 transcriptional regulator [Lachnotalea glycerini]
MSFVNDNFEMLSEIAKCIAEEFGSNCEVVLHDLTRPYNNTIVAIYHGHLTGRKIGDGGTNMGLAILRGTAKAEDEYGYINYSDSGRTFKSSSKYFKDENGKIVGSLCINYDITDLISLQNSLQQITNINNDINIKRSSSGNEIFAKNVDELIDVLLKEAIEITGKNINDLSKDDRINIVKYLDEKGAFLIKKSAEAVADRLGISRFTVYNYINA